MPTDTFQQSAQQSVQQSNARAFPAYPSVDRYFPGQSIEDARLRLTAAIERGDGPGLVIGASGTGKSLLLQALAQQFAGQFDVAQLSCSQLCSRRALVQTILFELGLPYRFSEEGDLRLTLLDHLVPNERCPNGILLLVDEAQTLPVRLLEEIRLLTNLVRNGQPRVRLVLAGSLALEEKFASGELETFQQRIAARCYLAPLGANEIGPYVQAHLETGGEAFASVRFEDDAFHAIYSATDGVPRLVNQICARTLQELPARSDALVDARAIQTAWADIQHLPTPWETSPESLHGTAEGESSESAGLGAGLGVVEFGELSDDLVDLSEPHSSALPLSSALEEGLSTDSILEVSLSEKLTESPTESRSVGSAHNSKNVAKEAKGVGDNLPIDGLPIVEEPIVEQPVVEQPVSSETCEANCLGCSCEGEQTAPDTQLVTFQVAEQPAANPFEESFHEEEIVLEDFAALGEVLLRGTPKVESQLDDQMSQLVHDVETIAELRSQNEHAAELDLDIELENPASHSGEILSDAIEETEVEPEPVAELVDEIDTLQTVPLVARAPKEVSHHRVSHHRETFDPVLPEEDYVPEGYVPTDYALAGHVHGSPSDGSPVNGSETSASTLKYPGADIAICDSDAPTPLSDAPIEPTDLDEEDDILIVEDAPVEFNVPEAEADSVHRQDYRQLFAKLSRS